MRIQAILNDIAARGDPGSVLVFLPGWNEIMLVMNFLNGHSEFCESRVCLAKFQAKHRYLYRTNFVSANKSKYVILPLHSQLTGADQRMVFDHYGEGMRKVANGNCVFYLYKFPAQALWRCICILAITKAIDCYNKPHNNCPLKCFL